MAENMQARRVKFLRYSALILPPEMEVSFMSVTDIVAILTLVINIIRLVFDMSNNKKK
jgi:hypothetical protein